MELFSLREQLATEPKIIYRDEIPLKIKEIALEVVTRFVGEKFLNERIVKVLDPFSLNDITSNTARAEVVNAEWFRLFDIVEDILSQLDFHEENNRYDDEELRAYPLRKELNQLFVAGGVGWKITENGFSVRGDSVFEKSIEAANQKLHETKRFTARDHLKEAVRDLSRRPEVNLSGAVFHSQAALESLARQLSGLNNKTLGQVMKDQPDLLPKPLDQAVTAIWGYASEHARHAREGVQPGRKEAELSVAMSAALIAYWA